MEDMPQLVSFKRLLENGEIRRHWISLRGGVDISLYEKMFDYIPRG